MVVCRVGWWLLFEQSSGVTECCSWLCNIHVFQHRIEVKAMTPKKKKNPRLKAHFRV